nr:reverse transcriptase domain-containing protein [Tanacetum cinerariifolium]
RSFLNIGRALIDVYEGELTLRVSKEAVTFNLDQTSRYSANYDVMFWSTNGSFNGLNNESNNGLIIWRRRGCRNGRSFVCISNSSGDTLQVFLRVSNVVTWESSRTQGLSVEESGLDEPELGNPWIDKLMLDKLEVGYDHD